MTAGDLPIAPIPNPESLTEIQALQHHVVELQRTELACRVVLGLAHDINNLLHVIGSSVDLLQRSKTTQPSDRRDLDRIAGATDRARNMLRRALDLLRRGPEGEQRISLCRVVTELQSLLAGLCGPAITITATFESADGFVLGDRVQLEQVLLNLAVNARDAMPKGGQLHLRVFDSTRSATASKELERVVVLEVSDTGPGIDETLRERIFTPFFSTKEQGRGLGLAVVHAVVTHLGGYVEVENTEGSGARFRLYFREAPPENEPEDAEQREG